MRKGNRCNDCEVMMINGKRCHETGCPSGWKDKDVECRWCGDVFKPGESYQTVCSEECCKRYFGEGVQYD